MSIRSIIVAMSASATLIGGFAAFVLVHGRSSDKHNGLTIHVAPHGKSLQPRSSAPPAQTTSAAASSSALSDYQALYKDAGDYWNFARMALPAAAAGNASAQFYLSRVLEKCDVDNRMFFKRRGQVLSLDEGLQWASKRHMSVAQAQAVYDRCNKFLTSDSSQFGSASEWLAKATQGGQPLAEATTALKALERGLRESFSRAGGVQNVDPDPELAKANPLMLLRDAARSKDPEVLFMIGEAQNLLYPAQNNEDVERHAWWLVACERGLDCSANGNLIKETCAENPRCQSAVGPTDLIQELSNGSWPAVQQRAQEISMKLDAGRWAELIPEPSNSAPTGAS